MITRDLAEYIAEYIKHEQEENTIADLSAEMIMEAVDAYHSINGYYVYGQVTLHRDDVIEAGYDAEALTDEEMNDLARLTSKGMENGGDFWTALYCACQHEEIQEIREPEGEESLE